VKIVRTPRTLRPNAVLVLIMSIRLMTMKGRNYFRPTHRDLIRQFLRAAE